MLCHQAEIKFIARNIKFRRMFTGSISAIFKPLVKLGNKFSINSAIKYRLWKDSRHQTCLLIRYLCYTCVREMMLLTGFQPD